MKICAFVANFTHSVIITCNYVKNNSDVDRVIFITQSEQKEKLDVIINKYFKESKISFIEWGNESSVYDYDENIIFAIYGSDSFVLKVNKYLKMLNFSNMIINLYDIKTIKNGIENIILKHDYYLDSSGIKIKK